jgi:hypothetical protein
MLVGNIAASGAGCAELSTKVAIGIEDLYLRIAFTALDGCHHPGCTATNDSYQHSFLSILVV